MKRIFCILILTAAAVAACQPEAYTGPLDSPVGNWEGIRSEYFFNEEKVADLDSCETSAISFYRQGQCCIEGQTGAFPFIYDKESGFLQIDSTLWEVSVLTGAEMVMTYLYSLLPSEPETPELPEVPEVQEEPGDTEDSGNGNDPEEEPEDDTVKPDANGVILPVDYKGCTINADKHGYFYINDAQDTIYCRFKGSKDPDGNLIIDFWFDRHTDYFIPLVVESKK